MRTCVMTPMRDGTSFLIPVTTTAGVHDGKAAPPQAGIWDPQTLHLRKPLVVCV